MDSETIFASKSRCAAPQKNSRFWQLSHALYIPLPYIPIRLIRRYFAN